MEPRRPRLKRVAVWTVAALLLVMGCVAGMPFAALIVAEYAPGLLRVAAIVYSPMTYGLAVGVGAVLAAIGSWIRHRSVLISVLAGMLSWAYVVYYVYTRNVSTYEEVDRRHRVARRFAIAVGICGLMLGWYVLAWVGAAKALNTRTISFDREPYLRTAFSPLIGYCDANWPGSVWLANFYYVVNPLSSGGYCLAPSYHGIRSGRPEPLLRRDRWLPPATPGSSD